MLRPRSCNDQFPLLPLNFISGLVLILSNGITLFHTNGVKTFTLCFLAEGKLRDRSQWLEPAAQCS